jgi:hypothetical protein
MRAGQAADAAVPLLESLLLVFDLDKVSKHSFSCLILERHCCGDLGLRLAS